MTATMDGFTHLADCPTCGRPRWVEAKCGCGHGVVAHDLGTKAGATVRTVCTYLSCGCKRYQEAVANG